MKKTIVSISITLAMVCQTLAQNFVSLSAKGNKDYELIQVFMPYPNSNEYVGYDIGHEFNTSDKHFTDQYRIISASVYKYDGKKMNITENVVMATGESESTYRAKNRADYTGGWHGDEKLKNIKFFIDGKEVKFTKDQNLIPCTEFSYTQESVTFETAMKVNNEEIINPNHPEEALHLKTTVFKNVGYTTNNRFTWKKTVDIDHWFMGIACVGKSNATKLNNEKDKIEYVYTGTGKTFMINVVGAKEIYFSNEQTGFSAHVISHLVLPANQDEKCLLKCWDREKDSKYYRAYRPTQNPIEGEVWESTMTVSHFKK